MKNSSTYKPIDCSFYDELELIAMRGKEVEIIYLVEEKPVRKWSSVLTLESKGGAEYMVLSDRTEIRLDALLQIDGKVAKSSC